MANSKAGKKGRNHVSDKIACFFGAQMIHDNDGSHFIFKTKNLSVLHLSLSLLFTTTMGRELLQWDRFKKRYVEKAKFTPENERISSCDYPKKMVEQIDFPKVILVKFKGITKSWGRLHDESGTRFLALLHNSSKIGNHFGFISGRHDGGAVDLGAKADKTFFLKA